MNPVRVYRSRLPQLLARTGLLENAVFQLLPAKHLRDTCPAPGAVNPSTRGKCFTIDRYLNYLSSKAPWIA
jgi:hypothetical protein